MGKITENVKKKLEFRCQILENGITEGRYWPKILKQGVFSWPNFQSIPRVLYSNKPKAILRGNDNELRERSEIIRGEGCKFKNIVKLKNYDSPFTSA